MCSRPARRWSVWNQAAWRATNTPLWSLIVGAALLLVLTPFGGVHFPTIPIAAAVLAAFLFTRAKASSLTIAGLSLTSAVFTLLMSFYVRASADAWLHPPWGELAFGTGRVRGWRIGREPDWRGGAHPRGMLAAQLTEGQGTMA